MNSDNLLFISIMFGICGLYIIPFGFLHDNDLLMILGMITEIIMVIGLLFSLLVGFGGKE